MESMGYQILRWQEGMHISVIAPGWQRPVRLSSIGYTKETLNARLDQNWDDNTYYIHKSQSPIRKATPMLYLEIEFRKAQHMDGLTLIFAIFIELLRLCTGSVEQQKNRPLSPMLREEVRKLDQYIEDYKLLCAENIGTAEELSLFSECLQDRITELESQRNAIRNRIRRATLEYAVELKKQAMEITKQITPLRKQLKSAQRIADRIDSIRQLLDQERQMETKERNRIREVVLKEIVLEAIQKTARYVQNFEPVFLYQFAKQNTRGRKQTIRRMKLKIEQGKKRIRDLDKLIERIYEDNILGKISDERFLRMNASYDSEQKELLAAVERDEQTVRDMEQERIDLNQFLTAMRECTDLKELTPTLVNTLIKRIEVHNSTVDENGVKHVPVDIHFTAVGIINIPDAEEILQIMEEIRTKPLKIA